MSWPRRLTNSLRICNLCGRGIFNQPSMIIPFCLYRKEIRRYECGQWLRYRGGEND